MQIKSVGFSNLPFSDLFKTYINNYDRLASFYNGNPLERDSLAEYAIHYSYSGDRKRLVEILKEFNSGFNPDPASIKNIDRLGEDAITIVTGQQLGIYGGPLFTVLKIITTIILARKLEKETGRAVVPVFWLADEDHDFDEVAGVVIPNHDETYHRVLPEVKAHPFAVADLTIPDDFQKFRDEIEELLPDTAFSEELWALLDDSYQKGTSFRKAFGRLITSLFSKHGLVLAGSNDRTVKEYIKNYMLEAVDKVDEVGKVLEKQSGTLAQKFHQQASTDDSLLFLLDEKLGRVRIHHMNGTWSSSNGRKWTSPELKKLVEKHPKQFSPNVFFRPLLQDALLPNIGYVAGPGELAYFGQMKGLYKLFGMNMPFIIPRMSATIIESPVERVMRDLPFEFYEYNQRIEDLEKLYIEQSNSMDINSVFDEWKEQSEELSAKKMKLINQIDASLEGTVKKVMASHNNELDKLRGKVFRAIKEKNDIQIKRIHKIHTNLFPDRSLQERVISFIYYMNKYGLTIWDEVIAQFGDLDLTTHKLIYI